MFDVEKKPKYKIRITLIVSLINKNISFLSFLPTFGFLQKIWQIVLDTRSLWHWCCSIHDLDVLVSLLSRSLNWSLPYACHIHNSLHVFVSPLVKFPMQFVCPQFILWPFVVFVVYFSCLQKSLLPVNYYTSLLWQYWSS